MPRQSPVLDLWSSAPVSHARAMLRARDADIVASQIAVSEIEAPTGNERRRGAWVAERFRALGLNDVRIDGADNVIGRRDGVADVAPVVICAHLDTVFPIGTPVNVRRSGPRLVGPGIGDNGRGLAAMLALADVIDGTRVRTHAPVDFVATVGEEGTGDLRGAKHLFDHSSGDARAAIALDGAGDERIVHRALGSRRFRITFRGPGGHSWTAFGVPNAVHAAALAAAKLARLPRPASPRTTLSVGRIGGGIAVNAIPEEGWLEVDLRSTSVPVLDRYEREIHAAARAASDEENGRRARGTPPLTESITRIGMRPGGDTDAAHPLVAFAIDTTRLIGREPELATASTDANVPISRGIPAIAIGAGGRGGDAHTPAEWFDNTDGHTGLARALAIVIGAAGLATGSLAALPVA
ncbi:MAG TPA: M20/M25/M40 family metallo-hydrolase [Gemmatimonadaceae bacterium]|nr:M20/M25/M40 family metallo-hydrolase [Gemmatimonadaceae bacterium]